MHRSRLAGLIIDCRTENLGKAADFWSNALAAPAKPATPSGGPYVGLQRPGDELYVEVQKVDHESRVHLDIETDNIDAEVARLEALGARRVAQIRDWWVMEAPTGQRFCVVPVVSTNFEAKAHVWD